MGKYNSSVYRVRPLMEEVRKDHQNFLRLLSLVDIGPLSTPERYRYDGADGGEMQLKPAKTHLLALIDYLAAKVHTHRAVTGADRNALFFGDKAKRALAAQKAKAELNAHYGELTPASRPWYLFEGFTNPDIFIEGKDYVIVCEGKWTEPHLTTTTTYLSGDGAYRSQMVRHIQGALNYSGKKVYAFYIVDAECGYTEELSKANFCAQLEQETIPLDAEQKKSIIASYHGYTTWQDIKEKLPGVLFREKSEIG